MKALAIIRFAACLLAAVLVPIFTGGCRTMPGDADGARVRRGVSQVLHASVAWKNDDDAKAMIAKLADEELTGDSAVRIALLNNRRVSAVLAGLGVTRADLLRAARPESVEVELEVRGSPDGASDVIEIHAAQDLLPLLLYPLRKRVAASKMKAATLDGISEILTLAASARVAFLRHQADVQILAVQKQIAQAAEAALDTAVKLHDAGNIRDLDLAVIRVDFGSEKLEFASRETAVSASHERLNALLGFFGYDIMWTVESPLPEMPADADWAEEDIVGQAVKSSLELDGLRQQMLAIGTELGLARVESIIPKLHVGVSKEREDGKWGTGPAIGVEIPLWGRERAKTKALLARMEQLQALFWARAVELRSAVRSTTRRFYDTRAQVRFYQHELMPLRKQIVTEMQLEYNAMQIGVFKLLDTRRRELEAQMQYVEKLRAYWQAEADLRDLQKGFFSAVQAESSRTMQNTPNADGGNGGH